MIEDYNALKACFNSSPLRIGFLGLGQTNLSIYKKLAGMHNVEFTLRECRGPDYIPAGAVFKRAYFCFDALKDIDEDVLFVAPSVKREAPEILNAITRGVNVTSDCEEFLNSTRARIFAVTGSDGKSTTATLISNILTDSGLYTPCIGNIGVPFSDAPRAECYSVELSSFNLEYFKPKSFCSVITNITPNHLNFHETFENYKSAKLGVLENADRTVLCYDDDVLRKIIFERGAFAVTSVTTTYAELKSKCSAKHYLTLEGETLKIDGEPIMPRAELERREIHNVKNALCAIGATAELYNVNALKNALSSFRGLKNRAEPVYKVGDRMFYDSSIDTSPARASTTLFGLNQSFAIIIGGKSKGLVLDELKPAILKYARFISVYGEACDEVRDWLEADTELSCIPHSYSPLFYDACISALEFGGSAILCPAYTSYGEFLDYRERGARFLEIIKEYFK